MIHCSNSLLSTAMRSCQLSTVNCQLSTDEPIPSRPIRCGCTYFLSSASIFLVLADIGGVCAILSVGAAPVGAGFPSDRFANANGKTLHNKFYFFP